MKLVITSMLLGFLVISCKKEANISTNNTSSDSAVVNNNDTMETVIPPTSDSMTTTSSIPVGGTDTVKATK